MSERDPAVARWAAIQIARAVGVVGAVLGLAMLSGRVEALAWLPGWLGFVLLVAGLIDVFVVPTLLARKWRSPR